MPYFAVMFKNDPAEARHDWPDFGDLTGRYVEAFVLARRMLGISDPSETEVAVRQLLLSYFDEDDGLSYRPKPAKPYYSTIFRRDYDAHVAEGFDQARVLWALLAWFEDSQDEAILERIHELIAGLDRVLVKKGNYGYYDRSTFEPGVTIDPDAPPMPHQFYFCGTQIHPLVECYRRLKIDQALELADRLSNYIVHHSDYFLEDGSWHCPGGAGFESAEMDGHTHSRFATIAGITTAGMINNDASLIAQMKGCYDWFIGNHCSSFGWSPEFLGRLGDAEEGCETCAIMDQLNCCFAFAGAGFAEYYEQAEKIARNQLFENQLLDTHLVRNTIEKPDTELSYFHNVADMVKGGFAGWAGPNDFIGNCDHHYCLMNCCGPAGARALHDVWANIHRQELGNLYINIWMDKDDQTIAIKNLQPAENAVVLTVKRSGNLHLMTRSWLKPETAAVFVDGASRQLQIEKEYIVVGNVRGDSKIEVRFACDPQEEKTHVNGRDYLVTWLGDSVQSIAPPGQIMPLYRRYPEFTTHDV